MLVHFSGNQGNKDSKMREQLKLGKKEHGISRFLEGHGKGSFTPKTRDLVPPIGEEGVDVLHKRKK